METLTNLIKKEGSKNFGEAILKSFEELGLGVLSKSDFEAFMFHHILLNIDKTKIKNNYDLMRVLKITPAKLRSLEMTRSAKFLDLNLSNQDNWKLIFNALEGKKLETENKENGKVRIYIDELHVHRLIERFVVESGSSIDYSLNKNQLVIKYNEFLNLLDNILKQANKKPLLEVINKDKSELNVKKEFEKLDSVFKDLKDSFKDKAYDQIAETALATIIKITRKQIGI
jgi:hypothetical protein